MCGYLGIKDKCVKCGKTFLRTSEWIFKDEKGYYCAWPCYNHKDEKNGKRYKAVEQYTKDGKLIRTHTSATEAAAYTGFSFKCIQRACREGTPYNSYLWKYKQN